MMPYPPAMRQMLGRFKGYRDTYRLRNKETNVTISFEVVDFESKAVVFLWYYVDGNMTTIIRNGTDMYAMHEPYHLDHMRNLWVSLKNQGFEEYREQ
jgi:hypothetical protein